LKNERSKQLKNQLSNLLITLFGTFCFVAVTVAFQPLKRLVEIILPNYKWDALQTSAILWVIVGGLFLLTFAQGRTQRFGLLAILAFALFFAILTLISGVIAE
jgi:hypothetical protein